MFIENFCIDSDDDLKALEYDSRGTVFRTAELYQKTFQTVSIFVVERNTINALVLHFLPPFQQFHLETLQPRLLFDNVELQ